MSYAAAGGARAGAGAPSSSGGGRGMDADSEYIRLDQKIRESLDKMIRNVAALSMDLQQLGTARDTPQVRDRLNATTEETKVLAREIGQNIKRIGTFEAGSENEKQARRLQQQKLKREFETALDSFRATERQKLAKEETVIKQARAASVSAKSNPYRLSQQVTDSAMAASGRDAEAPLLAEDPDRLQRIQAEINFNEAIIEERSNDIVQIEATIGEVNEIFKDLANIVSEQGEMLGQMDQNIESAVANTGGAAKQLRIANEYHKSARNKQVCCIIIVVVVIGIVIAAISLGLHK
eukprot:c8579_g1_i1.p2 GENE.c8579_g1_i1~~c8579_g1_i1.p2  ORF type:complete len:307 (-),score=70.77 c8579_g1_i1:46-927(-)